jgi:spore maturation protein A
MFVIIGGDCLLLSWIWMVITGLSITVSMITGSQSSLAGAAAQGAQSGITLSISMAGSVCLWSGVAKLMERIGLTDKLARLLRPVLSRLFPGTRRDPALARDLSANVCANILGLGNAATPMGIQAVKRMVKPDKPHTATDEMCRLVVLNTASIQLIPATVAAVRAGLGCSSPFDILPAVWITSLCSASAGVLAAWGFGKLWKND